MRFVDQVVERIDDIIQPFFVKNLLVNEVVGGRNDSDPDDVIVGFVFMYICQILHL